MLPLAPRTGAVGEEDTKRTLLRIRSTAPTLAAHGALPSCPGSGLPPPNRSPRRGPDPRPVCLGSAAGDRHGRRAPQGRGLFAGGGRQRRHAGSRDQGEPRREQAGSPLAPRRGAVTRRAGVLPRPVRHPRGAGPRVRGSGEREGRRGLRVAARRRRQSPPARGGGSPARSLPRHRGRLRGRGRRRRHARGGPRRGAALPRVVPAPRGDPGGQGRGRGEVPRGPPRPVRAPGRLRAAAGGDPVRARAGASRAHPHPARRGRLADGARRGPDRGLQRPGDLLPPRPRALPRRGLRARRRPPARAGAPARRAAGAPFRGDARHQRRGAHHAVRRRRPARGAAPTPRSAPPFGGAAGSTIRAGSATTPTGTTPSSSGQPSRPSWATT